MIDGQKVGPLTEEALMRRLDSGEINADTLIWRAGMDEWQTIASTETIVAKRVAAAIRDMKPRTPAGRQIQPAGLTGRRSPYSSCRLKGRHEESYEDWGAGRDGLWVVAVFDIPMIP